MKKIFIHILLLVCCFGLTTCAPEFTMEDVLFTVEVQSNDENKGTVTEGGKFRYKEEITLKATPQKYHYFTQWDDGNTDNPRRVTIKQDKIFIAEFAKDASIQSKNGHDYIDLGLPSGTLWATCNVGANKPEEYGDYFAWGETVTKGDYTWSTYKHCKGSAAKNFTKYCNDRDYGVVDNKNSLEAVDDAATAKWGSDWRMPTRAECQELIENCTWRWTTLNGINGCEVRGKNGNSIFLPAGDWYVDTYCHQWSSDGYYRSSSLGQNVPYSNYELAIGFSFDSEGSNLTRFNRCYGALVRPVTGVAHYTITTYNVMDNWGSVTGDGIYEANQTATLTAYPAEGYLFRQWKNDGSTENPHVITVWQDDTYVVSFGY